MMLGKLYKKSISTDVDNTNGTNTIKILLLRQNLPKKKKLFFVWRFYTLYKKKFQIWDHFFPLLFPNDSEIFLSFEIGLQDMATKRVNNWKNQYNFFWPQQFYTLYEQMFSNLRPFLFITLPQGSWKSKKFQRWTLGSGGKKTVKRSEKVWRTNTQTDKQTYRHLDLYKESAQRADSLKT